MIEFHGLYRPPPIIADVKRYYVVDLLRGFAAVSVLIWHYQHFIALGLAPAGSRSAYPFYSILYPFFQNGGTAVQLFWIISGFVFSAVYHGRVHTTREFVVNRIARLYPLHLVTLLVVAALQLIALRLYGGWLLYTPNDLPAFVEQLVMASGWHDQPRFTFNGPVWSVSAELLIYVTFWLVLPRLLSLGVIGPLAAALLCAGLMKTGWLATVWFCGIYFYLGCAVFVVHRSWIGRPVPATAFGLAALVGSVVIYRVLGQGAATLVVFLGLTLIVAALEETQASGWSARARWLGDSTYGIYLWHIPIQLAVLLLLKSLDIGREIAFSPWFFLGYIALILIVARASFLWIEDPARRACRRIANPRR